MKFFALLFSLCLVFPAFAEETAPDENCDKLAENLEACTLYKCTKGVPDPHKFVMRHEILGLMEAQGEQYCHHSQTIPGNGIIDCNYPEHVRKMMAKQLRGDVTAMESELISNYFHLYCHIIE